MGMIKVEKQFARSCVLGASIAILILGSSFFFDSSTRAAIIFSTVGICVVAEIILIARILWKIRG